MLYFIENISADNSVIVLVEDQNQNEADTVGNVNGDIRVVYGKNS